VVGHVKGCDHMLEASLGIGMERIRMDLVENHRFGLLDSGCYFLSGNGIFLLMVFPLIPKHLPLSTV